MENVSLGVDPYHARAAARSGSGASRGGLRRARGDGGSHRRHRASWRLRRNGAGSRSLRRGSSGCLLLCPGEFWRGAGSSCGRRGAGGGGFSGSGAGRGRSLGFRAMMALGRSGAGHRGLGGRSGRSGRLSGSEGGRREENRGGSGQGEGSDAHVARFGLYSLEGQILNESSPALRRIFSGDRPGCRAGSRPSATRTTSPFTALAAQPPAA
jgi:hypothetical protein